MPPLQMIEYVLTLLFYRHSCEAFGTKFEINLFTNPSPEVYQNTLDISVTDAYSIPMTCTYGGQSVGGELSGTCPDQQSGYCQNTQGHTNGKTCPEGAVNPVDSYFTHGSSGKGFWYWDCDYVAINWGSLGGSVSCSVGGSSAKDKRAEDNATELMARDELAEPTELQAREQAEPFKLGELEGGTLDVGKRYARKSRSYLASLDNVEKA